MHDEAGLSHANENSELGVQSTRSGDACLENCGICLCALFHDVCLRSLSCFNNRSHVFSMNGRQICFDVRTLETCVMLHIRISEPCVA
jgi:hypothetical protein